jgi:hypothetical protein
VGDEVRLETPQGPQSLEIVQVQYPEAVPNQAHATLAAAASTAQD